MLAALDDLDEIIGFVQKGSTPYSMVVAEKIRDAARDLGRFPTIGRIIPEVNDAAFRDRIIYNYRLIYRIEGDQVTILAVIHGARDLAAVLVDRLPPPKP